MNSAKAHKSSSARSNAGFFLPVLCLLAILAFLFKDSFKHDEVLFSNDGPLGVLKSNSLQPSHAFTGFWMDLYWVGMNGKLLPFGLTNILLFLLGPIPFAKFYGPITLLLLGTCAAVFFRTLKLSWPLCTVAALAAALNMNFFSNTCWGLGSRSSTLAMTFLALAILNTRRSGNRWLIAALSGLAVGMSVMEGGDNGAIFSLFVAAFVLFQSFAENETMQKRIVSGARLFVVVLFAVFIAWQFLVPLVGLASKGATSIEAPAEKKSPAE